MRNIKLIIEKITHTIHAITDYNKTIFKTRIYNTNQMIMYNRNNKVSIAINSEY